ncbi:MAG: hypothetical protein IKK66_06555 [Ruminococcus sp.]|nr:hypothetical protein [Ruminococcus sp.]
MDAGNIYQLEILRGRITSIIGRGVAAVLLGLLMKATHPLIFMVFYILVSWVWIFVKATRNWIIGIVAAVVAIYVISGYISEQPETKGTILAIIFLFGLIIYDIINIIRYISLKGRMTKEEIEARRMSK